MKVNCILSRSITEKVKILTRGATATKQISAIIIFLLLLAAPFGNKTVVRAEETFRNRLLRSNSRNFLPRNINNYPPPNTPYVLGAGDRININIFEVEEFSGQYLVLVDGTVSLPLIGNIAVRGLTLSQVSELINQKYSPFLRRPVVTVTLVAPRITKVAVAGEVNSPGSYEIPFGSTNNNNFASLTDLIQLAKGITPAADLSRVYIRRMFQGAERVYTVNLWELLNRGNLDSDVFLRDGDEVIVASKDKLDRRETLRLVDANFGISTDKPIDVIIVGQVFRPGTYKLQPEESIVQLPTVSQAIQKAGGINALADIRNIKLRRQKRDGSIETIDVNFWNLLTTGDMNEDLVLQQGDSILIPKVAEIDPTEAEILSRANFAPEKITVYVVGELKKPGVVQVPLNTPLNEAIAAAGFFDLIRANRSKVDLVRLNDDGSVTQNKITIDLSANNGSLNNPILRQNDAIIVRRSGLTTLSDTIKTIVDPLTAPATLLERIFNDTR